MSTTALITGASSGIGKATAEAFVGAGFITYASARRVETLSELAALGCRVIPLDVTDEHSMVQAVAAIELAHGAVDVLVNNAGYGQMGPVEELPLDCWRRQFETNVFGLVRLTQLVLPAMRRRGRGRIINVSSMGGEFTTPIGGAYHATKYAVESLSDALRFEVEPFGIDVVIIQPGPIKTRLGEEAVAQLQGMPGSAYEGMVNRLGRISRESWETGRGMGKPEQVARVILRSAQARQPRTRYKITPMARLMPLLRGVLSDRIWDGLWRRMLRGSRKSQEKRASSTRVASIPARAT